MPPSLLPEQESSPATRERFAAFLERVASMGCTPAEYRAFAVTHYTDAALETARVQLVRTLLGSLAGPARPASLPEQLRGLARTLRERTA